MKRFEFLIEWALFLCALLSVGTTIGIIAVLAVETTAFLREVPVADFLFGTEWTPLFSNQQFGVLPLVVGTMLVSAIAMVVAAGSFFLGPRGRVPEIIYYPSLLPIPVLIPVAMMVFWLVRLRVKKSFRGMVGVALARTSPAME